MKTYTGGTSGGQRSVTVEGRPLRVIYLDGHRRSVPFDWGNESPGAEHLAQAVLLDYAGENAVRLYARDFMIEVVSKLLSQWDFKSEEIEKWLKLKHVLGRSIQQACSEPPSSQDPAPPAEPLRPRNFPHFPIDPRKRERPKGRALTPKSSTVELPTSRAEFPVQGLTR